MNTNILISTIYYMILYIKRYDTTILTTMFNSRPVNHYNH